MRRSGSESVGKKELCNDGTKYSLIVGTVLYVASFPFMIVFNSDYWLRLPFYATFALGLCFLLCSFPKAGE